MQATSTAGAVAMTLIRPAMIAALLFASTAHAGDARYLSLLNRAHDSVVAMAVAPAGDATFEPRPIDMLAGGGDSTTVRLADAGCRFDLRLQFRNGRMAIYRDVDVCSGDTLVIAPLPRRDAAQAADRGVAER
jgi:hypothetical protein